MTGDYQLVVDTKRENREAEERASAKPPIDCPRCGNVLQVRGLVRNCPTGDFRWGA